MPTTNSRNLTLTLANNGNDVTIRVTYNAVFSEAERKLDTAVPGVSFRERIRVLGVDPPGGMNGTVLHTFPVQLLPVTAGSGSQTIARNRTMTVPRASLNEDPGLFDADEIRCRIEIVAVGLPPTVTTAFTDQEILAGLLMPPIPHPI